MITSSSTSLRMNGGVAVRRTCDPAEHAHLPDAKRQDGRTTILCGPETWTKQLVALKFLMSCERVSVEVVLACTYAACFSAQDEVDWCHDPKLRKGCGCSRKVVGLIWSMRASSPRCSDQKLQRGLRSGWQWVSCPPLARL